MTENRIFVFIFIVVVFVLGGLFYIYNPDPVEYKNPEDAGAVCTLDAKLCPDGSYVGRVPPNCEFRECSATTTPIFEDGTI